MFNSNQSYFRFKFYVDFQVTKTIIFLMYYIGT